MRQIVSVFFLLWTLSLSAEEALCSKEVLTAYFPKPFVVQTLKENQVPKEKIKAIVEELSEKDVEVVHIVEARASRMNPNPLRHPAYKMKAGSLFRQVMLQVFSEVMDKHTVFDKGQLQLMLDDIQYQKAKQLSKCMLEYREEKKKRRPEYEREEEE